MKFPLMHFLFFCFCNFDFTFTSFSAWLICVPQMVKCACISSDYCHWIECKTTWRNAYIERNNNVKLDKIKTKRIKSHYGIT